MAVSIDDKVKDIIGDPKAVEVLNKLAPGFTTNKQLKMAYGMTLRAVQKFPQAKISDATLVEIEKEFSAI